MPATVTHIQRNLERIREAGLDALVELVQKTEVLLEDGTQDLQASWKAFLAEADAKKLADKIPGSVGRKYAAKYGRLASRPKRGAKVEILLSPAAYGAIQHYRKPSDQFRLTEEPGAPTFFTFTNRRNAVKALNAMIQRSVNDIELPARESAAKRSALKALLKKVDI